MAFHLKFSEQQTREFTEQGFGLADDLRVAFEFVVMVLFFGAVAFSLIVVSAVLS